MSDFFFKMKVLFHLLSGALQEWKTEIWEKELDTRYCCDGNFCGCGGATIRDMWSSVK